MKKSVLILLALTASIKSLAAETTYKCLSHDGSVKVSIEDNSHGILQITSGELLKINLTCAEAADATAVLNCYGSQSTTVYELNIYKQNNLKLVAQVYSSVGGVAGVTDPILLNQLNCRTQ